MKDNNLPFDHIQWLEKFQAAYLNKDVSAYKKALCEIFEGTLKYVQSNGYKIGAKYITIDSNDIFSEYYTKPEKLLKTVVYKTNFSVINADCLETAEILLNSGFNPCVLNLANEQNPGGGVSEGYGAQEENLFRRTNLFMSLYQFAHYAEDYGIQKNENSYPLNRDNGGIYSNNITVFRGSEKNGYCLLNNTFRTSIATVAAICRPELEKINDLYYITKEFIEPTKEKIRTILRIAGKHKHDCLILGAFGCGAFANPPNHMAKLFKEVFLESEFLGTFKYIVFSIYEDGNSRKEHNPNGNVLPFFEVFNDII